MSWAQTFLIVGAIYGARGGVWPALTFGALAVFCALTSRRRYRS